MCISVFNFLRQKIFINPTFWSGTLLFLVALMIFNRFFFEVPFSLIEGSDFLHFVAPAQTVREGKGYLLYDVSTNFQVQKTLLGPELRTSVLTFRNLPFVTLIFLPFTFLPLLTALRLFGVINIVLILFTTVFLRKYISKTPTIYLFTILFTFIPIIETLKNGQLSIFLTLLISVIYIFLIRKKDLWVGVVTSLLLIKTQFVIFFPFLLLISKDKRTFFLGYLWGVLIIFLASSLIAGPSFWLHYPKYLLETEGPKFGSRVEELFTLYAFFQQIGIEKLASLILNGILYGVSVMLFKKNYKNAGFNNSFIALTLFSLSFSMHILLHDLSILTILLFILTSRLILVARDGDTFIKNLFFLVVLYLVPILAFRISAPYLSIVLFGTGFYFLYNKTLKYKDEAVTLT
ncbi:hypothetical protein A2715_01290 [Candidatus Woesebacteria bacterium RIFCSPHIGHO2_01_FULL_39_32]|uniref:Glycosyltransferase RgtA/B/C/D-like domain-containing protein n=1 Tax=Candidatus Woesebacteria bacterium RIFCSPLOWO2_01_FULL_39_25 TaxID=1802521 RepID=A0A1F8BMS7_9BACT|nr:MAG: hypothetical protein A2124_02975 [Candidatus Woesebacteria bacterium GWB1_37_5]OGM24377.1 MAG: hypothetical protein A2715_01290 [Candidatus Woesebacteria bacterium RIFCSPHIGHO2_01_FULL_39_32]OGM37285.1 MAG: hypothetical protein A3F01_01120 [Candidatus Woesebacteria bacterium RIFCSPHIGHO2_12_FULL_38_11]OGM65401.1 MAG: hypothetical protein A2893_01650 [Candidatus Woesebacteria bacterium RIFCSPLOWO2_01_FULL_39_25]